MSGLVLATAIFNLLLAGFNLLLARRNRQIARANLTLATHLANAAAVSYLPPSSSAPGRPPSIEGNAGWNPAGGPTSDE